LSGQLTRTPTNKATAKILVVDDDPQVRRTFRAILASQGCSVIEARDGNEAIEEIKADAPDLVLLDINMPGIDGFETCRQIRGFSDVPIIIARTSGAYSRSRPEGAQRQRNASFQFLGIEYRLRAPQSGGSWKACSPYAHGI
jgi:CheY-like chemotaxis protein